MSNPVPKVADATGSSKDHSLLLLEGFIGLWENGSSNDCS